MSCEYIDDLRLTIKRAFVSGNYPVQASEIDLGVIEALVKDSNLHCTGLRFEPADTLNKINGIKLDEGNGNTVIYYASSLNYCWARFTVAKEMSNVLMDRSFRNYVTTMPSILLAQLSSIEFTEAQDTGFTPDLLAELGACELLLPKQYEMHAINLIQEKGMLNAAKFYGVPEKWIERRFDTLKEFF